MLTFSLFVSAYLSHCQEQLYQQYGRHIWKEMLFFIHFFSLIGFLPILPSLYQEAKKLADIEGPNLPLPLIFNDIIERIQEIWQFGKDEIFIAISGSGLRGGEGGGKNVWIGGMEMLESVVQELNRLFLPSLIPSSSSSFSSSSSSSSSSSFSSSFSSSPTSFSLLFPLPLLLLFNLITQSMCISGVYLMTSSTSALTMNLAITVRKLISLIISVLAFDNREWGNQHWLGSTAVLIGVLMYTTPAGGTGTKEEEKKNETREEEENKEGAGEEDGKEKGKEKEKDKQKDKIFSNSPLHNKQKT